MSSNFVLSDNDAEFKAEIERAADEAIRILERDMEKYISGDLYPADYQNGRYEPVPNGDLKNHAWEEGFWTGQLWLAYELSGKNKFKELAEKNVVDFAKRMEDNILIDWHHDTGFLYTPSCVAAYRIAGNELAKKSALEAAYSLSRRFRISGEFIQSMSFELDAKNYRFIIDTMMNLPLLFWATEVTGDNRYREKAIKHAETTRKNIIREDGSTYHHFLMDYETGNPKGGLTLQGAGAESCWSRGQSWMVYGSALMYAYTGDRSWIHTFETVTDYFINHLPSNHIPHWDFSVMGTSDDDRDTSAAAIACCGIMEMANHLSPDEGKMRLYIETAKKIMTTLARDYAMTIEKGEEGLLTGVTGAKPQGICAQCEPYGDYFYMEALVRALTAWKKYW